MKTELRRKPADTGQARLLSLRQRIGGPGATERRDVPAELKTERRAEDGSLIGNDAAVHLSDAPIQRPHQGDAGRAQPAQPLGGIAEIAERVLHGRHFFQTAEPCAQELPIRERDRSARRSPLAPRPERR